MNQTLRAKSDVFSFVDNIIRQVPSGELRFKNEEHTGKIYVHEGHIIWAFATGQSDSFQNILINEGNVPKDHLNASISKSRESGKKHLDDILIEVGVDSEDSRKDIIRRHTEAALKQMSSWGKCKVQVIKGIQEGSEEPKIVFPLRDLIPTPGQQSSNKGVEPASEAASGEIESIDDFFAQLKSSIDGYIAATLVDIDTGTPIAFDIPGEALDLDTASAFYRDVGKSAQDALVALGKAEDGGESPIQEILITGTNEYVLLRMLKGGEQLLYLLQDTSGNPGKAMVAVRQYVQSLEELF